MTRLDDIRARVERSVGEKWNIDPDIPFLLSLVERAVPMVEHTTDTANWRIYRNDWLRDAREKP